MKRFLEEARRILRISSVYSAGNEELANYAALLMQNVGLKVSLQSVIHSSDFISRKQFNVIGILGDPLVDRKIRTGLLLINHLDTASPGVAASWTQTGGDPFQVELKQDKIYGLGAADAKLDFLCKIQAAQTFRERKIKMPLYIVGTCADAFGMLGTRYLLQSKALNPKYVVVGKPTGLQIVHEHVASQTIQLSVRYNVMQKGAQGFNRRIVLRSRGQVGAPATPAGSANALEILWDFLTQASSAGFETQYSLLGGGSPVEQIPDEATCELFLTSHQLEDFKRFYRDTQAPIQVELGGVGDSGVRFLPASLFELIDRFRKLKDKMHWHWTGLQQETGRTDLFFQVYEPQTEEFKTKLNSEIEAIAKTHPALNISSTRLHASPVLQMSEEQELVKIMQDAARQADIQTKLMSKPYTSQAGHFFQMGFPAAVFGPGKFEGVSHAPNEFNEMPQLERAIKFYEHLIERVCL